MDEVEGVVYFLKRLVTIYPELRCDRQFLQRDQVQQHDSDV